MRVSLDRMGEFEPWILHKYASNANELEEKITGPYAKRFVIRDIEDSLPKLYSVQMSAHLISTISDPMATAA